MLITCAKAPARNLPIDSILGEDEPQIIVLQTVVVDPETRQIHVAHLNPMLIQLIHIVQNQHCHLDMVPPAVQRNVTSEIEPAIIKLHGIQLLRGEHLRTVSLHIGKQIVLVEHNRHHELVVLNQIPTVPHAVVKHWDVLLVGQPHQCANLLVGHLQVVLVRYVPLDNVFVLDLRRIVFLVIVTVHPEQLFVVFVGHCLLKKSILELMKTDMKWPNLQSQSEECPVV